MRPHPSRLVNDYRTRVVGQEVLLGTYNGQVHYNWQQNSWNVQPSTSSRILHIKILDIDPTTRTCKLLKNFACDLRSTRSWYFTEIHKETVQKADLDAIIRISADFIDRWKRDVDEHDPWRGTVYTDSTSDESQLVMTPYFLVIATQEETGTNTSSRPRLKEQSLDASDMRK